MAKRRLLHYFFFVVQFGFSRAWIFTLSLFLCCISYSVVVFPSVFLPTITLSLVGCACIPTIPIPFICLSWSLIFSVRFILYHHHHLSSRSVIGDHVTCTAECITYTSLSYSLLYSPRPSSLGYENEPLLLCTIYHWHRNFLNHNTVLE